MSIQTALIDSSVLYQAPVRDLLLQLAFNGTFKARWSNLIHDEWISNLLKNRPDISKDLLEITKQNMNRRILDCLVTDFEYQIDSFTLPDPDDRHILAAAIACQANCIVTFNLKDFPSNYLSQFDLEAIHPDEFMVRLAFSSPSSLLESAKEVRTRLKSPPLSVSKYIDVLTRQRLVKTAEFLNYYESLI